MSSWRVALVFVFVAAGGVERPARCVGAQAAYSAQQEPGNPEHTEPPAGWYCSTHAPEAAKRCMCHRTDSDPLCEGEPIEDHPACRSNCYPNHCHCDVVCTGDSEKKS